MMEGISKDLISLLQYLLPGFLAAWVFHGFTSHPKPNQFEQVVQALIFTLLIQAVVFVETVTLLFFGQYWQLGLLDQSSSIALSTFTGALIGVLFAYSANSDLLHSLARKLHITSETSYPSEWFGAFLQNVTYVVLHLEDERRLYGWPVEWPSEPNKGHFVLEQPSWIVDGKDTPITGVASVMVNAKDVKWVEFMERSWEKNHVKESI